MKIPGQLSAEINTVYILKKAKMLPGGMGEARQLASMYKPEAIEDKR